MPKADSHKKKMADPAVLLPMAGFTIWGFSLLLTRIGQRHAGPMVLLYFISIFLSGIFYKPKEDDDDEDDEDEDEE